MAQSKNLKKYVVSFVLFLFVGLCGFSILAFSWYAGYLKKPTCLMVANDSELYKSLNCEEITIVSNADDGQQGMMSNESTNIEQDSENTYGDVVEIVEENSSAVVGIAIDVENNGTEEVIGSSFLISEEGLLVTNRHVVEEYSGNYYVVFKSGKKTVLIDNENIFRDPINDIAIIKISKEDIPVGVRPIKLGDSDEIKVGEGVVAIGNPLGEFTGTVTRGIVSGLNREVNISKGFFNSSSQVFQGVIQTDAAINPGNSGGPLLNLKGQVIGINFATIEGASNLSFALPINWIKARISEVQEYGKFRVPFVGIEFRNKILFIRDQNILGAEILNVIDDGPAHIAGLKKGDVIVSFDNSDLNDHSLIEMIQKKEIGEKVELIIMRSGQQLQLNLTIGEK